MPLKKSKPESLLTIFYKNPELGKVKTRLAAAIGEAKAYSIHLLLCEHTIGITEKLSIPKAIYYSDFIDRNDNWSNNKFQKYTQTGFDIGEKMANAFRLGFNNGYRSICIIGTDCLDLTTSIINEAFRRLLTHDVVIGPANGGCYYLLGMNYLHGDLFKDKKWTTAKVLPDTVHTIKLLGLSYWELEPLNHINDEKDLPINFRAPE
jgi:rSAM/selenodomain-associated transferase 1